MDLRKATLADADLLYDWRTEGEQATWYEGPPTKRYDHYKWLSARVRATRPQLVRIYIAEVEGVPVGVVRLDSNDELSIEIAPEHRHKGYGPEAIQHAVRLAGGRVKASVDATNTDARMAFEKAGFSRRPDVTFYLYRP